VAQAAPRTAGTTQEFLAKLTALRQRAVQEANKLRSEVTRLTMVGSSCEDILGRAVRLQSRSSDVLSCAQELSASVHASSTSKHIHALLAFSKSNHVMNEVLKDWDGPELSLAATARECEIADMYDVLSSRCGAFETTWASAGRTIDASWAQRAQELLSGMEQNPAAQVALRAAVTKLSGDATALGRECDRRSEQIEAMIAENERGQSLKQQELDHIRKLVADAHDQRHRVLSETQALQSAAEGARQALAQEMALLEAMPVLPTPNPHELRAVEACSERLGLPRGDADEWHQRFVEHADLAQQRERHDPLVVRAASVACLEDHAEVLERWNRVRRDWLLQVQSESLCATWIVRGEDGESLTIPSQGCILAVNASPVESLLSAVEDLAGQVAAVEGRSRELEKEQEAVSASARQWSDKCDTVMGETKALFAQHDEAVLEQQGLERRFQRGTLHLRSVRDSLADVSGSIQGLLEDLAVLEGLCSDVVEEACTLKEAVEQVPRSIMDMVIAGNRATAIPSLVIRDLTSVGSRFRVWVLRASNARIRRGLISLDKASLDELRHSILPLVASVMSSSSKAALRPAVPFHPPPPEAARPKASPAGGGSDDEPDDDNEEHDKRLTQRPTKPRAPAMHVTTSSSRPFQAGSRRRTYQRSKPVGVSHLRPPGVVRPRSLKKPSRHDDDAESVASSTANAASDFLFG
jgi:hypothetical protein